MVESVGAFIRWHPHVVQNYGPNVMCYFDIWWKKDARGTLKYPNHKFPSNSTPQVSFPGQTTLFNSKQTKYSSPLSPSSRFQFLASPQNCSNKPIASSSGKQRVYQSLDTKSLSPGAPGYSLCHWVQPACGLWGMWCLPASELWVYVTNELLWFICPVLGVGHPHSLRTRIPLSPTEWIGGGQKP